MSTRTRVLHVLSPCEEIWEECQTHFEWGANANELASSPSGLANLSPSG